MIRFTLILLLSCLGTVIFSQETLTLEKAIQIARENSLRMKQSQISVSQAEVSLAQAKQARYPTLNLGTNYSYNVGRSVNPLTYQFETTEFNYTNLSANTGISVFGGNQINRTIQQARLSLQSAQESLYQQADDIALEVALNFLNLVFAEENLANAEAQLKTSQVQLDQILKSIEAGASPTNDRYEFDAQLALREQNLTQQKNAVMIAQLNLQQILLWEGETPIRIERPNIDQLIALKQETLDAQYIYEQAMQFRHDVRSSELGTKASAKGIDVAKSGYWPRLSLGLGVNSGFTDLASAPTDFETQLTQVPGVFIDGESVNFQTLQLVPVDFENISLGEQLDRNLGMGISVNLQIPIYNRRQVKSNVELSRLQYEQSVITELSVKQSLRQNIQQAVADYQSARENLAAQQKSVTALEAAYKAAQRRYDVGQGNSFELANAKNQLDAAINQLTIARYDYVFKMKVIDFYLGRGLSL